MEYHECNLNIRYDLPAKELDKLNSIYQKMDGWLGYGESGIPYWFSFNENEPSIFASLEPSGLLFCANMNLAEWNTWKLAFKKRATEVFGFKVGEIEEGEVED